MNRLSLIIAFLSLTSIAFSQDRELEIFEITLKNNADFIRTEEYQDTIKTTFVINRTPTHKIKFTEDYFLTLKKRYNKLEKSTFNDFSNKYKDTIHLDLLERSNLKITTLDNYTFNGWGKFYEDFTLTTGIVELSNIGFNEQKTQAIIYFGHQSGPLVGGGQLIIYEFKKGKWKKVKEIALWVS